MSHIVLFHSALGLRRSVLDWATQLSADGHVVHTPDLYGGAVFDDLGPGVKMRDSIGIPELMRRAQGAVGTLPSDLVYAGFSMGAAPAQLLAAQRAGAKGALLMHGALPISALGLAAWPKAVPMQIHFADKDPWMSKDAVAALQRDVESIEVFQYEGASHLFADPGHADYEPVLADTMFQRIRQFCRER